jgi:hypothetical protein
MFVQYHGKSITATRNVHKYKFNSQSGKNVNKIFMNFNSSLFFSEFSYIVYPGSTYNAPCLKEFHSFERV